MMVRIAGIRFAASSTIYWQWLACVGISSEFRLSELLIDVSMHTVRTDLGAGGRAHNLSLSKTGTVEVRSW